MLWLLALACSGSLPADTASTGALPLPSGESMHLVRLTHLQWENTVVDLLGLPGPTGFSGGFVSDPAVSTFENDGNALVVTPVLWQQYQEAAESLALRVVSDPILYANNVPQASGSAAQEPGPVERDEWLREFGERAFRRPLRPAELVSFVVLFTQGDRIFGSGDPFVDGVHACIAAFLQSPAFLYRSEGVYATGEAGELPAQDLASKLSYALWNTMPDAELRAAALAGLPADALGAQVDRMLAAPAAHSTFADLHRQLLHVDNYSAIYRPSEELLGIDVYQYSTPASMQAEVYAFVEDVVFNGGTVRDLFTSSRTFADSRLAEIYGIPGIEGDELVPVDLDSTQRAGLLTLSGFLAWEADTNEPNLIERGAFVNAALLCVDIPPPPPDATALPVNDDGLTLRERVEEHTSVCGAGCHTTLINPIGFAFGAYDEDGRYVDLDQGEPIDATGTYTFEDGEYSYDGAVELAAILADQAQVHRCYVSHLVGYLEGRAPADADAAQIESLTAASLGGRPILDLVADIVTSEEFRQQRP